MLSRLRLEQWKNASINRRIFVAIGTVGTFAFLAKLASMAKDLFVAPRFGVSSELDAFLVAFIVGSLVISLVGSSFKDSLIPLYVDVKTNNGKDAARELVSLGSGRLLLILFICTIALAIAGPLIVHLVGSQFDPATLQLCQKLYFICLPCIMISGLSTIWGSILNAEDRFALAATTPALVPIGMVAMLVLAPVSWGVYSLAFGMLLGYSTELLLLARSLHKRGLLVMPRFWKQDPLLKRLMKQFLPAVTGGVLAHSTDLVDQTMAAALGAGSVSILIYGSKLTSFAVGIASIAISSAVLPYFSSLVAKKDWDGIRRTYWIYAGLILTVAGIAALTVIVFSEPLIKTFFQHGAFTAEDTQIVSYVQNIGILELPFFALMILTVRLHSALKGNHILAQAALLNGFVNVTLNYVFIHWIGVAGIALSTVGVYVVVSIFLFIKLRMRLRKAERGEI